MKPIPPNKSFHEMQALIMEPSNANKINAENCFLKDELKNFSTSENGACEKYIFDDSVMRSTIGRVL